MYDFKAATHMAKVYEDSKAAYEASVAKELVGGPTPKRYDRPEFPWVFTEYPGKSIMLRSSQSIRGMYNNIDTFIRVCSGMHFALFSDEHPWNVRLWHAGNMNPKIAMKVPVQFSRWGNLPTLWEVQYNFSARELMRSSMGMSKMGVSNMGRNTRGGYLFHGGDVYGLSHLSKGVSNGFGSNVKLRGGRVYTITSNKKNKLLSEALGLRRWGFINNNYDPSLIRDEVKRDFAISGYGDASFIKSFVSPFEGRYHMGSDTYMEQGLRSRMWQRPDKYLKGRLESSKGAVSFKGGRVGSGKSIGGILTAIKSTGSKFNVGKSNVGNSVGGVVGKKGIIVDQGSNKFLELDPKIYRFIPESATSYGPFKSVGELESKDIKGLATSWARQVGWVIMIKVFKMEMGKFPPIKSNNQQLKLFLNSPAGSFVIVCPKEANLDEVGRLARHLIAGVNIDKAKEYAAKEVAAVLRSGNARDLRLAKLALLKGVAGDSTHSRQEGRMKNSESWADDSSLVPIAEDLRASGRDDSLDLEDQLKVSRLNFDSELKSKSVLKSKVRGSKFAINLSNMTSQFHKVGASTTKLLDNPIKRLKDIAKARSLLLIEKQVPGPHMFMSKEELSPAFEKELVSFERYEITKGMLTGVQASAPVGPKVPPVPRRLTLEDVPEEALEVLDDFTLFEVLSFISYQGSERHMRFDVPKVPWESFAGQVLEQEMVGANRSVGVAELIYDIVLHEILLLRAYILFHRSRSYLEGSGRVADFELLGWSNDKWEGFDKFISNSYLDSSPHKTGDFTIYRGGGTPVESAHFVDESTRHRTMSRVRRHMTIASDMRVLFKSVPAKLKELSSERDLKANALLKELGSLSRVIDGDSLVHLLVAGAQSFKDAAKKARLMHVEHLTDLRGSMGENFTHRLNALYESHSVEPYREALDLIIEGKILVDKGSPIEISKFLQYPSSLKVTVDGTPNDRVSAKVPVTDGVIIMGVTIPGTSTEGVSVHGITPNVVMTDQRVDTGVVSLDRVKVSDVGGEVSIVSTLIDDLESGLGISKGHSLGFKGQMGSGSDAMDWLNKRGVTEGGKKLSLDRWLISFLVALRGSITHLRGFHQFVQDALNVNKMVDDSKLLDVSNGSELSGFVKNSVDREVNGSSKGDGSGISKSFDGSGDSGSLSKVDLSVKSLSPKLLALPSTVSHDLVGSQTKRKVGGSIKVDLSSKRSGGSGVSGRLSKVDGPIKSDVSSKGSSSSGGLSKIGGSAKVDVSSNLRVKSQVIKSYGPIESKKVSVNNHLADSQLEVIRNSILANLESMSGPKGSSGSK